MDEQTWEGVVRLEGTRRIPAGGALIVRPGTRVVAAAGAALRIEGRLEAPGAAGGDIVFSGEGPWEGISVGGRGEALLRCVRIKGAANGLRCEDRARIQLSFAEILEARSVGILATGQSRVTAEDTLLALGETGVTLQEAARAGLARCRLVVNQLCGVNAMMGSRLEARDCRFEGNHTALSLRDEARADVRGCTISRHHVGVYARHAVSLNLVGNRFVDNRQAVELLDQARVRALLEEPVLEAA